MFTFGRHQALLTVDCIMKAPPPEWFYIWGASHQLSTLHAASCAKKNLLYVIYRATSTQRHAKTRFAVPFPNLKYIVEDITIQLRVVRVMLPIMPVVKHIGFHTTLSKTQQEHSVTAAARSPRCDKLIAK